jgi:hypothetical protein
MLKPSYKIFTRMSFFNPTPFRHSYVSQSIVNSLREYVSSRSSEHSESHRRGSGEEGEESSANIDDDGISFSGDFGSFHAEYEGEGGFFEDGDDEEEDWEEEDQTLIDMEILVNETRKEEDRFSVLSKEPNILINPQIEKERRDGNPAWTVYSESTWRLLESLALPKYPALLSLYVRHCVYVASNWLQMIMEELKRCPSSVLRKAPNLDSIPSNFKADILPKIQSILYKVQHRRWLCCISKKYQDGICIASHCPQFRYVNDDDHTLPDSSRHPRSPFDDEDDEDDEGRRKPFGYSLYFTRHKSTGGDPYREVKKEVNISATLSSNSQKLVPILWALEMRLLALMYIHDEWVTERRTAYDFPQLGDSRTLYSIHNPMLCEKTIMQYNIKEVRDALGRLHWRWNDMRPSDDLISYLKLLKDRCALISICAKIEKIKVNTAADLSIGKKRAKGQANKGAIVGGKGHGTCPPNIDAQNIFSHFVGSNQQNGVLLLCSDLLVSEEDFGEGNKKTNDKGSVKEADKNMKSIAQFLAKRRKVNRKIEREIRSMGSGFSSLYDHTTRPGTSTDHGKNIHGDTEVQPRMVRVNLDRGEDLLNYSSSEEDEGEGEGDNGKNGKNGEKGKMGKMGKRGKRGGLSRMLSKKGKRKRSQGEDDNYFEHKARKDVSMYQNFGKRYTDEDICSEILTRSILSSVPYVCMRQKEYTDVEHYLENAFMRCLTTSSHLHKPQAPTQRNQVIREFTATCVTRTNLSFLTETHAIMCEMDEEIRMWETLMFLDAQRLKCGGGGGDVGGGGDGPPPPWLISSGTRGPLNLPSYVTTDVSEQIDYEKGKIESVLSWGYDYCNGKRNQFMSRNIRELFFIQYLLPGETEILTNVNHLKNSSIVPSIVVSRLRNDVERLDKLIYDFTLYHTIAEFAKENGCTYQGGIKPFVKLGKHLFEASNKTHGRPTVSASQPSVPSAMQRFYDSMEFARECSVRDMLLIHTNQSLPYIAENEEGEEERSSDKENPAIPRLFRPTYEHLENLTKHCPSVSFINPNISIAWKSPRGITQVVRVILLQCMEFFMKEIHHSLEAKRFFFTKQMSIRLMNDRTFMAAVESREDIADLSRIPEISVSSSNSEEEEEDPPPPNRSDVFDLLHPSSSSSYESRRRDDDFTPLILERHMRLYASFRFYMQNRFEIVCQNFYYRFPVVLYCMTSSFVFWPESCLALECKGADELLGYYSWLDSSIAYISNKLMPHLFAHFNLTIRTNVDFIRDMLDIMNDTRHLDSIGYMQDMEDRHFSKYSKYRASPYPSGGIHYRVLLMLIDKIPSLGQNNKYCKMCSFACKVVVQLCYLLYPDILERNRIHIPPPTSEPNRGVGGEDEWKGSAVHGTGNIFGEEEEEGEGKGEEDKSIFVFRASASDM